MVRNDQATPYPEQPAPSPHVEAAPVSITLDGDHIGGLHVRPGVDEKLVARVIEQLAAPAEWAKLGVALAARGPHRLAIATRAAVAVAGGGRGVSLEEEDRIAQWFAGIVDEAIRRGGLFAAAAIWVILVCDDHANPSE